MDALIAYDLGTGGNKASLYDAAGQLLATEFVPYATDYPQAGWHEQRPERLVGLGRRKHAPTAGDGTRRSRSIRGLGDFGT